jgi:hypothetical protein
MRQLRNLLLLLLLLLLKNPPVLKEMGRTLSSMSAGRSGWN